MLFLPFWLAGSLTWKVRELARISDVLIQVKARILHGTLSKYHLIKLRGSMEHTVSCDPKLQA